MQKSPVVMKTLKAKENWPWGKVSRQELSGSRELMHAALDGPYRNAGADIKAKDASADSPRSGEWKAKLFAALKANYAEVDSWYGEEFLQKLSAARNKS